MPCATAIDATTSLQGDYPLANTEAAKMLAAGLDKVNEEKGWSQRHVARLLNYKTSVVLSHMASGRVPIPIDRSLDFARLLGMDPAIFIMAVMEQRHPNIDFRRILASYGKGKAQSTTPSTLAAELESIAGMPLDELPMPVINVLREAVADRNSARRFVRMAEVPLIEHIRRVRPDGLSPAEMKKVQDYITSLG